MAESRLAQIWVRQTDCQTGRQRQTDRLRQTGRPTHLQYMLHSSFQGFGLPCSRRGGEAEHLRQIPFAFQLLLHVAMHDRVVHPLLMRVVALVNDQ